MTTIQALRKTRRIVNAYDMMLLAQQLNYPSPAVGVLYRPQMTGRGGRPAAWQVHLPGTVTDPAAFWADYKTKTFDVSSRHDKNEKRDAAVAWASQRYGYEPGDWVTITGLSGAMYPRALVEYVKEAIAPYPVDGVPRHG